MACSSVAQPATRNRRCALRARSIVHRQKGIGAVVATIVVAIVSVAAAAIVVIVASIATIAVNFVITVASNIVVTIILARAASLARLRAQTEWTL